MVKIVVRGLTFSYNKKKVLDSLDFEVEDSEILSLVGPNGCGKTTLIKCIDRILKPEGNISLRGRNVFSMSRRELARYVGYVPQSPSGGILSASVFDTVLMGRKPYIGWRVRDEDIDRVLDIMKLLHVDQFALKDFNELSGGQKQKILIARALCQEPEVLLLDEPTSNLDLKHQLEVMDLIRSLIKKNMISAVMAIHDLNLAAKYSDSLVMLKDGKIHAMGSPKALLNEDNIRTIFEVESTVMNDLDWPYVVPIKPINCDGC